MPSTSQPRSGDAADLGARIRSLREEKGKSLRGISRDTGVSVSFLSQVERGLASPSVATLLSMARALGEPVASLFTPTATGRLIRASERPRLIHPQRSWEEELLTPRDGAKVQVILSRISPRASSGEDLYSYEADEAVAIVLKGKIHFWIEENLFALEPGDSLMFDPRRPHRLLNPGGRPAEVLWVHSPPAY